MQTFDFANAWAAGKVMGCFLILPFCPPVLGFNSMRRLSPECGMWTVCFLKTIKNYAIVCCLHLWREVLISECTWENSHHKLAFTITDRSSQTTVSSWRNHKVLLKGWDSLLCLKDEVADIICWKSPIFSSSVSWWLLIDFSSNKITSSHFQVSGLCWLWVGW